jgi:acyl carrier protein
MELSSEIKELIAKLLAFDIEDVTDAVHLQDDLGVDSLGLWNLTMAINKRYEIELIYDEIIELENVGELISLVKSKK